MYGRIEDLLDQSPRFKEVTLEAGVYLLGFIISVCLYAIKPFKRVKLCKIYANRIGELAIRTDTFLRCLELKNIPLKDGIFYLGIAGDEVSNVQLLKMYKRKFPIIQNKIVHYMLQQIVTRSVFRNSMFFEGLPYNFYAYQAFNNTKPVLHFTASEEKYGKKLLNKIGISDDTWYICFHSRDPVYLLAQSAKSISYHNYRDCGIKNYIGAARYIASLGGFAVRMGHGVAEELPHLGNPRIIDYASRHRSDFGDIYLPAKCKFFLGNTSGICWIATIFNVPIACANIIPLKYPPFRKDDLFIPKKIWDIKKKRFLTFHEILGSEIGDYSKSEQYAQSGLRVIQNTTKEILDLTKEMNQRLNGNFEYTKEDEELQKKFQLIFRSYCDVHDKPPLDGDDSYQDIGRDQQLKYLPRIGTKFLRENKELLD